MTNCNCSGQCPTLKLGNRGSAVAFVQNLLRQRRYNLRVDGIFGQSTRNAVLAFQRNNNLSQTGNVDNSTWRALGVTCLPSQYYPPTDRPQPLPSFPDLENRPQPLPSFPDLENRPQPLPSFPDLSNGNLPGNEPNLDGLNYTWEEIGDFRYILTTNKARYAQGEEVYITFRKRNISDETLVLRYPSEQLFDFYISNSDGQELYRFSDNVYDNGLPHEMVMAPGEAESKNFVWNQVSNYGQWVRPQQLTLWGVNNAVGISIPLPFSIY